MGLVHPFVSNKSDSSDTTKIQPSNWNAGHVLTTSGLAYAKTANGGILTAGAGQNYNQYLKRKFNASTDEEFEFVSFPTTLSADFNFTAQSPSGTLTAGITNTVTLSPVPLGINGTDSNHYLYIAGVGTPEAVLITGGTAISGAASGTITFVPANSHSAGWIISSATAGIQEAIQYNSSGRKTIVLPDGFVNIYAPITILTSTIHITGSGQHCTELTQNTINTDIIRIGNGSTGSISGVYISNLTLLNSSSLAASSSGYAVNIRLASMVKLTNVRVYGNSRVYRGVNVSSVIMCQIFHCAFENMVNSCIYASATVGSPNVDLKIQHCLFGVGGADMISIGAYCQATYIIGNEMYGMTNCYGISITPGSSSGSFNWFLWNNDISTSEADAATNGGGVYCGQYSAAFLSGNSIGGSTSNTRPAIYIAAGGEAQVYNLNCVVVGQLGIDNRGLLQVSSSQFNGSGTASNGAISAASTATKTQINGCTFYQYATAPILLNASSTNNVIVGNVFLAITNSTTWTGTPTSLTASNNSGVDGILPTVASAATISIPNNPTIIITGTTTITTINGGWYGRRIHLVKPNVGNVTVGGGGNIPATFALNSFQTITLYYASDGNWY